MVMNCPIKEDLESATVAGGEFSKKMKEIRDELAICDKCPELKACPARKDFDVMVSEIIKQLNEEWGL
jgi:predicted metal-binding transcription factor (methanogenesis marker protein 9)